MKIKKQLQIQRDRQGDIIEIFRKAIKEHLTHAKILELRESRGLLDYPKGFPISRQEYLRGAFETLMQSLYYEHVFWKHKWQGKLYDTWTDLPEEAREFYRKPENDCANDSNFYWKDSEDIFH
jgi:hypothetical protein